MKQFNDLGLAEPLLRAVAGEGYTTPTPIQAEVIPTMLAGRDIIGIAQTGTGKTAAFVLPLLQHISQNPVARVRKRCRALVLTPTRELAAQIAEQVRAYGRFTRPSTALVVGGAKPGPQVRAMAPGVDVVIATPGRLEDHLARGLVHLDSVDQVILDEADQMLNLGFIPAIRRIMAKLPGDRQTALLSATMPKQIRALARDFLRNPAEIAVAAAEKPIERIDQRVVPAQAAAKRGVLVDLLKDPGVERAIVFTRTKRGAERISQHLQKASLSAVAIHGDKNQNQRDRALADFKRGRATVLVATDIAARGIDIDDVSHVVNFELPNVPEAYVHRIGRTARAGKSGFAVSLCDAAEVGLLRDIERLMGLTIRVEGGRLEGPAPSPARNGARRGFKQQQRDPGASQRRRRSRSSGARKRQTGQRQEPQGPRTASRVA